jgi:hypothetical protein
MIDGRLRVEPLATRRPITEVTDPYWNNFVRP